MAKSRPARWVAAVDAARAILGEMEEVQDRLTEVMQELADLRDEYEEWRDNLPENLQGTALGDKLDQICDMDFSVEVDLSEVAGMVDSAYNAELPLGFGRD